MSQESCAKHVFLSTHNFELVHLFFILQIPRDWRILFGGARMWLLKYDSNHAIFLHYMLNYLLLKSRQKLISIVEVVTYKVLGSLLPCDCSEFISKSSLPLCLYSHHAVIMAASPSPQPWSPLWY